MWAELWLPDLQLVITSFTHKTSPVLTEFHFFLSSASDTTLADWKSGLLLQPFIASFHHFLCTLRYVKVFFSNVLMLGLWEVVSVVNQLSHVSKVNTLCVTQICKCFRYNTGFFLDTYRVRLLPESRRQPLSVEHSRFAPNPGGDNIKALHAGGWICVLWVSDHWPKQPRWSFRARCPRAPTFLMLFVVSANNGRRGRLNTHFCSLPAQWGSSKALVRTWCIHTFVFMHWGDYCLPISAAQRRSNKNSNGAFN